MILNHYINLVYRKGKIDYIQNTYIKSKMIYTIFYYMAIMMKQKLYIVGYLAHILKCFTLKYDVFKELSSKSNLNDFKGYFEMKNHLCKIDCTMILKMLILIKFWKR